jgi:hypothetical protein
LNRQIGATSYNRDIFRDSGIPTYRFTRIGIVPDALEVFSENPRGILIEAARAPVLLYFGPV